MPRLAAHQRFVFMSEGARIAWRLAIAVALSLLAGCFFRYDISLRIMTATVILSLLPSFSHVDLRNRLLITWVGGFITMMLFVAFFEAYWLYLPVMGVMTYALIRVACKSHDAGTIALVSLAIASFTPSEVHPLESGIYRIFYTSLGIVSPWIAFLLIPPSDAARKMTPSIPAFSRRDALYIALTAMLALILWWVFYFSNNVLVIFSALICAIKITEEGAVVFGQRVLGAFIGTLLALVPIIMLASLNNLAVYLVVSGTIAGGAFYLTTKIPNSKPFATNLCIFFGVLVIMTPHPSMNLDNYLGYAGGLWLGTLAAIVIMIHKEGLRKFEDAVDSSRRQA